MRVRYRVLPAPPPPTVAEAVLAQLLRLSLLSIGSMTQHYDYLAMITTQNRNVLRNQIRLCLLGCM